jgi:hypothetical protein
MLKPQFLLTHKIPLTIYRRSLGEYVDGRWVEGSTVEVEVQVNIQPLKGYEILQLPESERTRVWWKLYSADLLRTAKEGDGGWDADEFVWKGDRYKIMKLDDWQNAMGILEHCKAYATRISLTPN